MCSPDDLVGIIDIAKMYGVSHHAVNRWRKKPGFPDPIAKINNYSPIWDKKDIQKAVEKLLAPAQ